MAGILNRSSLLIKNLGAAASAARNVSTSRAPTSTGPSTAASSSISSSTSNSALNQREGQVEGQLSKFSSPLNIPQSTSIPLNSPPPESELNVALDNLDLLFSKCELQEWPIGVTNAN